jgi:hypothetical protein
MGENIEAFETDEKGDDGRVGRKRAGRRAEGEEGTLKEVIEGIPNAREIFSLERSLQMAEVSVDVATQKMESRLERKGRKLTTDEDLILDLLLKEATSEISRADDGNSEKLDPGFADIDEAVDR